MNDWLCMADIPTKKTNKHAVVDHCKIGCTFPAIIARASGLAIGPKVEESPPLEKAMLVPLRAEANQPVCDVVN